MRLIVLTFLGSLLVLQTFVSLGIGQTTSTIVFTGKLDGYRPDPVTLYELRARHPSILVGMGDNLATDYVIHKSFADPRGSQLGVRPTPDKSDAIKYLKELNYTALVPGLQEFSFGAAFLKAAELPFLGSNIVFCPQQKTSGSESPEPPPSSQVLLPTQTSLPSSVSGGSASSSGKGKGGGSSQQSGGGGTTSPGSAMGSGSAMSTSPTLGCSAGGDSGSASAAEVASLVFPSASSIYPWTTSLVVSVPLGISLSDYAIAISDGDEAYASNHTHLDLKAPSMGQENPRIVGTNHLYTFDLSKYIDVSRDGSTPDVSKTSPKLIAGSRISLKLTFGSGQSKTGAPSFPPVQNIALTVQRPFFRRVWQCTEPNCQASSAGASYVVFGVLDPNYQSQISQLNRAYYTDGEHRKGAYDYVGFNDATSALMQSTFAYEFLQGTVSPHATYIVLAQMTSDVATNFTRALSYRAFTYARLQRPFDMVFSAADPYSYTPEVEAMRYSLDVPGRIPVITPRPLLLPAERDNTRGKSDNSRRNQSGDFPRLRMQDPFETLSVTSDRKQVEMSLAMTSDDGDARCVSGDFTEDFKKRSRESIDTLLHTHLATVADQLACSAATDFECLALVSMRDVIKADIAIIQRRDLYTDCYDGSDFDPVNKGPYTSPQSVTLSVQQKAGTLSDEEKVRRMLPEIGYLTRVSVSGATLQGILKQNEAISNEDPFSGSPTAIDRNRSLVMLGITKGEPLRAPYTLMTRETSSSDKIDPANTYFVNGIALNPSTIYTIATTDRLATGEPNFPGMSQEDLVKPQTFLPKIKAAYPIMGLVLAKLHVIDGVPTRTEEEVIRSIPSIGAGRPPKEGQFVASLERPFEAAALGVRGIAPSESALTKWVPPATLAVENRRYLSISLPQLSVSYSFTHPSLSDQNIGTYFAGVTNANANSPHSDSASAADNLRVSENVDRHVSYGLDQLIAFSRSRSGSTTKSSSGVLNTDGSPLPLSTSTLSANSFIISPFLQIQPFRNQPHLGAMLRELSSSDVATNLQYIKSGSSVGRQSLYFVLDPLRQQGYGFAVGPRLEFSSSNYFELGYLRQYTSNILNALTIPGVLPTTVIRANTSASLLLASVTNATVGAPLKLSYNEVRQNGLYMLTVWNLNLFNSKKFANQVVAFGNVFGPGNPATRSSTETSFAGNVTDALTVSLIGNLSFGPQYTLFLFGDQATIPPNTLTRQQLSVSLSYSFDWHQGLSTRAFWTPVKNK